MSPPGPMSTLYAAVMNVRFESEGVRRLKYLLLNELVLAREEPREREDDLMPMARA